MLAGPVELCPNQSRCASTIGFSSPMPKIQASAPTNATRPTNTSAPTKEPVSCTMKPMTMGMTMPERLAAAENSPPSRPSLPTGAIYESTDQPEEDIAWQKKAKERMAMTRVSDCT